MLNKMNDECASSSGDDSENREFQLQLAFEKGLLKEGLNYSVEKKRAPINNAGGLKVKLAELRKDLDWVERLDVCVKRPENVPTDNGETTDKRIDAPDDDFHKELSFYKQAQKGVREALGKLHALGVATLRPPDYYAEMAKSDAHMTKVREKLVNIQQARKKYEAARRIREERKFASKVQKDVITQRLQDKKKLMEEVKKRRKGFQDELDEVLEPKKQKTGKNETKSPKEKPKISKKRQFKNEKFGFGGRKKGKKINSAESFSGASSAHQRGKIGGSGKKKGKRLGKGRRKQQKNRKK